MDLLPPALLGPCFSCPSRPSCLLQVSFVPLDSFTFSSTSNAHTGLNFLHKVRGICDTCLSEIDLIDSPHCLHRRCFLPCLSFWTPRLDPQLSDCETSCSEHWCVRFSDMLTLADHQCQYFLLIFSNIPSNDDLIPWIFQSVALPAFYCPVAPPQSSL